MDVELGLVWLNRQRKVSSGCLCLPRVAEVVRRAWPGVDAASKCREVWDGMEEVFFVLVSDARIAALHGEFLSDPTPTDVITFQHGEIVISAETAWREAQRRGLRVTEEIARYAVHGLLHLAGWTDGSEADAAEMRAVQEKILRRSLGDLC